VTLLLLDEDFFGVDFFVDEMLLLEFLGRGLFFVCAGGVVVAILRIWPYIGPAPKLSRLASISPNAALRARINAAGGVCLLDRLGAPGACRTGGMPAFDGVRKEEEDLRGVCSCCQSENEGEIVMYTFRTI
jgi:hypothetical protein